jgi:carbon storage regulator
VWSDVGWSVVSVFGWIARRASRPKEPDMLVLSRKCGESLVIGDEVRITVNGVRAGKVSLGIEAPRNITVHRQEIYINIKTGKVRKLRTPDSSTD